MKNCWGANTENDVGMVTETLAKRPLSPAVVEPICSVWNEITTRSPATNPSPLTKTVDPPGPLSRLRNTEADPGPIILSGTVGEPSSPPFHVAITAATIVAAAVISATVMATFRDSATVSPSDVKTGHPPAHARIVTATFFGLQPIVAR
jgi:hypothetical protein